MDGNDDCGALSSWYVFSAIGLYPIAGTDRYWIGAPIVDKAEINMGSGRTLTVIAESQSLINMYVQNVTLNGTKLLSPSLKHADIMGGGTLVFTMGPLPVAGGGY
jgi:putative alpha-1,2-mannosidase